jgi:hypothetical protein
MSVLITAAAAVAALRAAGHTVARVTGPDAARRYGCQTLRYVVDGRAVNLGRLRQMATAEPAPVAAPAEPVAGPARLNATSEPAPVSLARLAADLGRSLGLSGAGHLPAARGVALPPAPPAPPAEPVAPGSLAAGGDIRPTRDHAAWALEAAGHPVTPATIDRAVASCPPLPARRRVALPGETLPPAPPAPPAEPVTLPELRDAAAAGRPVSLARLARALADETRPVITFFPVQRVATLAQALADDLATPGPTPDSLRARAVTRSAEGDRLAAAGDPDRATAAVAHADALIAWADQLSPAPTGDAWAGQPWDPGTPDARARVALQGERVAILWPIAQALTGAGVNLPGAWATDGPVMAGEWPTDRALAALPIGAIATAAAALAALPPVTRAQARALELCRGQGVAL